MLTYKAKLRLEVDWAPILKARVEVFPCLPISLVPDKLASQVSHVLQQGCEVWLMSTSHPLGADDRVWWYVVPASGAGVALCVSNAWAGQHFRLHRVNGVAVPLTLLEQEQMQRLTTGSLGVPTYGRA